MNNTLPRQSPTDTVVEAEIAIHEEVRKKGLEYAELSPMVRELLAAAYVRGGIEAVERIKKDQKKALENPA